VSNTLLKLKLFFAILVASALGSAVTSLASASTLPSNDGWITIEGSQTVLPSNDGWITIEGSQTVLPSNDGWITIE
jgi:ABC-type phosphate transport system substrate-binding protein